MRFRNLLPVVVLSLSVIAGHGEVLKPDAFNRQLQIAGTYTGTLFAAGYDMQVTTTFYCEKESLCGEYVMDENGTMIPGQLTEITFTDDCTIECVWVDQYGSGEAIFLFTENFVRFDGFWSGAGGESRYYWWGEKPYTDLPQPPFPQEGTIVTNPG